jgi:hypothetical protein
LPSSWSGKSCTPTRSGSPVGCHSHPPLAYRPTSSFFLVSTLTTGWPAARCSRACSLPSRNCASPVRVLGALLGLEGALQRVALLGEQPPHGVVADLEPLAAKRIGQLAGGLTGPPQRRLGISTGRRVDQLVQRLQQARLALDQPFGPTARTPDAATRSGGSSSSRTPAYTVGATARCGVPSARRRCDRAPGARTGQQAALLLGQVRSDQLVQPGQDSVDIHAATLPPWHAPTATIGQANHAGTP